MHHIAASRLYLPLSQGGFGMYSVNAQHESLKLSWITKFLCPEHQFWKIHLVNQFRIPITQVLQANITYGDVTCLLHTNCKLHPFWRSVFKIWCKYNFCQRPYKDAMLVYNSACSRIVFDQQFLKLCNTHNVRTLEQWCEAGPANAAVIRRSSFNNYTNRFHPSW